MHSELAPEGRWVAVEGLRLHVEDYGGDGRVLVFAHPTGFLGAVWRPVIARLRAAGFDGRVLTYDARGHGLSSKPDRGYDWPRMAMDLRALMNALDVRGALGVGHSGGATTLALVEVEAPGTFAGLVMVDPILLDPDRDSISSGEDNPMAARTERRRLVWSSREEIFASYRSRPPYDRWLPEALRAYVDWGTFDRPDGEVELLCPGRIEAQVYREAPKARPFEALERLDLPVHLVRGELSESFTEDRAARAMAAIAGARLSRVERCGHFVPMEQPQRVAQWILDAWARL